MTTDQWVTVSASLIAFIASLSAAAVSIYNVRFRRFARERWWERQVEAYSRIIDALSGLVYYHEEHLDAEFQEDAFTAEHWKEINEHWKKGYAEVKRATAVGAFLISVDAETALQKMWKEGGKGVDQNDWYGLKESHYVAARDCLRELVEAARKDLRIAS